MLELMARGGMRINEVLKLTPRDVDDRKLILHNPKSGKEVEVVYIPQKVATGSKSIFAVSRQPQIRGFPDNIQCGQSHSKTGWTCCVD